MSERIFDNGGVTPDQSRPGESVLDLEKARLDASLDISLNASMESPHNIPTHVLLVNPLLSAGEGVMNRTNGGHQNGGAPEASAQPQQ